MVLPSNVMELILKLNNSRTIYGLWLFLHCCPHLKTRVEIKDIGKSGCSDGGIKGGCKFLFKEMPGCKEV